MADDSDLERTEPASSKRLEDARAEGQVPQSRELMSFLVLLAGVGCLWSMSSWISSRAVEIVRQGLTFGRDAAFSDKVMFNSVVSLGQDGMMLVAPVFFLTMLAAIASPALLGGWVFSSKALGFKLDKLNPLQGMKRIFSLTGVSELVKAVLKTILMSAMVYWVVMRNMPSFFAMLGQPLESGTQSFFHVLFMALTMLLVGVAVIVMVDVPFQLWQYYDKLKMTREELKEEAKQANGDPHIKARIRAQQRQLARNRMMAEVPKADVVVTNPTHFAIALKYDATSMGAPQVIAKGMNLMAFKIRELAAENNVPILEAPPLARALYRHAEIGEQVPGALYTAVAEVMAYIYQLKRFIADGGKTLLPPVAPVALPVPAELDPGVPE